MSECPLALCPRPRPLSNVTREAISSQPHDVPTWTPLRLLPLMLIDKAKSPQKTLVRLFVTQTHFHTKRNAELSS